MKTATKRRLTKAQKRVLIAKDVIKQVKAELTIAGGTYCEIPGLGNAKVGDDLQRYIKRKCFACAKGAIFVAHVRRFDEVTVTSTHRAAFCSNERVVAPLLKYFEQSQLDSIERHYELFGAATAKFVKEFGDKDRSARLIGICENIISNKGTFEP